MNELALVVRPADVAQQLAEDREYWAWNYEHGLRSARKEGRAEGRVEGGVHALLMVIKGRGIAVSDSQRERIEACQDPATLERWLERASSVASVAELLG